MRRILVENARRKGRQKRGGDLQRHDIQISEPIIDGPDTDILAIDEALTQLSQDHPENAELVRLRYFAGLTLDEAALALGISSATADRRWQYARAWLARRLDSGADSARE
jgi:RNA polymerase sigma factor (TIGR02999 family)